MSSLEKSDAMGRLKVETAYLHRQIESHLPIGICTKDLASYAELLSAFYGYYQPIETHLVEQADCLPVALDYPSRMKTASLVADLRFFGINVESLPRCQALPKLTNVSEMLGCLYVLEGSTLGGQIIRRMLAANLGLTAHEGVTYFSSYGDLLRTRWQSFGKVVSEHADTHSNEVDSMISAAKETFVTLDDWMSARLAHLQVE